jgi:hypothetical protein
VGVTPQPTVETTMESRAVTESGEVLSNINTLFFIQ